ncbi:Uncharacterised protein [Serratia liquefaciens]|nr:Uncharacterised protein [Serratia liquefaciens]
MLVEQVDLPVNECAQEVTFPKLDDTVRVLRAGEITTGLKFSQWVPSNSSHTT